MKKQITSILVGLATCAFTHAQSPTPTPTPTPRTPIIAIVNSSEIVSTGSLAAIIAALPETALSPSGLVCSNLRWYVQGSGTMARLMVQYTH